MFPPPKYLAQISGQKWKSVYPTPLLTLKQHLNGAQTQAVFLYFSLLNSERKHLYFCPCKVSQIMMPFFYIYIKPHLVFFANEMMNSKQEKIVWSGDKSRCHIFCINALWRKPLWNLELRILSKITTFALIFTFTF